ncbi:hypothetical protein IQ249_01455 [Lusitaniella coriacea LEGE 07157]|uniref:Uncharacterized protein n=1 Tax=Lusitaniella coriacea LEGE 07157 TaxID=945747 RepID=A0A8J7ARA4_9CYAN|nr:hypothetical protein [Lusitaniella coriacea]MBE9114551.1 hypothetical protein [Lusitaniella coriacea LEGE 07157]
MYYLYFLANASLTLRVADYLRQANHLSVQFVTVIHQIDGWIIKIKLREPVTPQEHGDFKAYMSELGIPYEPEIRIQMAFWSLETGQSPIDVMRRYQVAIVSHGAPEKSDIEAFRRQFTRGLGYCPETLA